MLGGMMLLFAVVGLPCIASAILEPRLSDEQADKLIHIFMGERGNS